MTLEKYQKKRNFSKTSEPKVSSFNNQTKNEESIFVIHDHHSRNHHHDLRLEMSRRLNGSGSRHEIVGRVLRSWALPKLTPLLKGEKHLAIGVEDHPMEYADFEGNIPEGEYGAGKVKIFDKGTYSVLTKTNDLIDLEFFGKKIKGNYILLKLKKPLKLSKKSSYNNWLFFKK
jgi:DNA ligase D-like protein (predicted 3'-phosphoesterase)